MTPLKRDQRRGNLHLEFWRIAGAETLDHRVVGCQLLLGLAALAVRDALDDQHLGNLELKVWHSADPQARLPPVAHSQRRQFIVAIKRRHELDQVVDDRGIVAFAS